MSVVFFSSERQGPGTRIREAVEARAFEEEMEIHSTLESLTRRLARRQGSRDVAVLVAVSQEELLDLLLLRDLLHGLPLILVLPNREPATISRGHGLRPRFLTYVDGDPGEIAAVLDKMLSRKCLALRVSAGPVGDLQGDTG